MTSGRFRPGEKLIEKQHPTARCSSEAGRGFTDRRKDWRPEAPTGQTADLMLFRRWG
jgi:hypothetical protein